MTTKILNTNTEKTILGFKGALRQRELSKKAVSLRSFPLFRWAVPVSRSSFRSTDHSQRKKQEFRKKNTCFFLCFVPSLHTVTSCVRRGYCICKTAPDATPNAKQSLHLPPLVLWRLLNRQPSSSRGTPKGLTLIICSTSFYFFACRYTLASLHFLVPRQFPVCGGCQ
jgi:hypothetical protein